MNSTLIEDGHILHTLIMQDELHGAYDESMIFLVVLKNESPSTSVSKLYYKPSPNFPSRRG